jgi:hypothetical protein
VAALLNLLYTSRKMNDSAGEADADGKYEDGGTGEEVDRGREN